MPKAQVSSISVFKDNDTAVIRGRAFGNDAVVLWRAGGNTVKSKPLYLAKSTIITAIPNNSPVLGALVAVENPGEGVSRFAPVETEPGGATENVLLHGPNANVPFRLVFIANPFLRERGRVRRDPIIANPAFFRKQLTFALNDLFERSPKEFFSESSIRKGFRVSALFDSALRNMKLKDVPEELVLCMRRRIGSKFKIEASRRRVLAFLAHHNTWADVAVVFSGASSATPTAWFGTDNYARGGVPFEFDGRQYLHSFYSAIQGVIAFSRRPVRPFEFRHEFLHASSSFNSGQILDEYDLSTAFPEPGVDTPFAINKKLTGPVEPFANYSNKAYAGVSLGSGSKRRFVPAQAGVAPCIMNRLSPNPKFDKLIRDFMRDRFVARLSRPF